MSKEEMERLLGVKTWLQEEISDIAGEKERLKTLLRVVDMAMGELPIIEIGPKPELTLAEIKRALGSGFTEFLDFSQKGNVIAIRSKRFLERDVWLAVTDMDRQLNGRWISAGEDSRWEIYLDRTADLPPSTSSDSPN